MINGLKYENIIYESIHYVFYNDIKLFKIKSKLCFRMYSK